MKKLVSSFNFSMYFCLILFFFYSTTCFSQNNDYDKKYITEYVLKDIRGNEINKMTLYRNGSKMKFVKINNKGKEDEVTTGVYILQDEQKVYTIISSKKITIGYKHSIDMSYVGMLTGVYIFELGNDGSIFNNRTRSGNVNVIGKDCVKYNIITSPDGSSDYYMYQDNLMLKRFAGTSTDGSTLEALSYNTEVEIPESTFLLPADVQFLDN